MSIPAIAHSLVPTQERVAHLDRLGDEIAELSAHLDAATARLLRLIREFDDQGGWNTGFRSCAAWLSWRVGLDMGAARERVRVARALGTLPLLAHALASGELSYAKVRALTRVATPETEARLLAVGRAGTAAHVERIVRGWRRMDRQAEARETARRHAGRTLHVYQDEDGMVVVRGRLEPEVGELLAQALAAAREMLYQRARAATGTQPADPSGDLPTMAQRASGCARPARGNGAASGTRSRRPRRSLPGGGARRCRRAGGSGATRPIRARRGEPRFRGNVAAAGVRRGPGGDAPRRGGPRTGSRGADSDDLRRALHHRDHGCRFPGCTVRFGQGHHLRHWAQGGPTTLSNLALLCRRHHRAVHEEGYRVTREPDGALLFRRPDGRALPDVPAPVAVPDDVVETLRARHASEGLRLHACTACPGWLGERLDVGWAIDVLHPRALPDSRVSAEEP